MYKMKLIISMEKYWEMTALNTIFGHLPKEKEKDINHENHVTQRSNFQ